MGSEVFLKPRLTGDRFADHAVPLEILKDFAVLEEMVIEVAKWQFLNENPDRKRTPRGFSDGVALKLTGLEEGSAVLSIGFYSDADALLQYLPPIFQKARDAIFSAIAAAEADKDITSFLPEKALNYFDRIGRSLRKGEAIEFISNTRKEPARLTKETRKKLLLASTLVKEYTEEVFLRGKISEADQDKLTFEILMINGKKVTGPVTPQHRETILEAFNGYSTGLRVLIKGIGKYSRQEKLLNLESIEHITILDELDVPARLEELSLLKAGWLEGGGTVQCSHGLVWLSCFFEKCFPNDLPLPYIYPMEEGGVQAEWTLKNIEASLEIDIEKKIGAWHSLDITTEEENIDCFDFNSEKEGDRFIEMLRKVVEDKS